jgi:hypothetical protein
MRTLSSSILLLFLSEKSQSTLAWLARSPSLRSCEIAILHACSEEESAPSAAVRVTGRRGLLQRLLWTGVLLVSTCPTTVDAEVVRAVGSGELACREANNCLETGELDGAVGWSWGAKDRCDPSDPLCGPEGRLREQVVGQVVPLPASDITHVAAIKIEIGRGEVGVLRLGFYGNEAPVSVKQMIDFLSKGLLTSTMEARETIGMATAPVALSRGGIVDTISPGLTVDFGVRSQSNAYARSRGLSKAGSFMAQTRPMPLLVGQDRAARSHNCAGLVSIPAKGLGYGGSGFETEDEAFESSFLITAASVPALDTSRIVVGQVLDAPSMAFLERLASLPTKRGIRGVIPGQTAGQPLLKVVVRETETAKVVV